MNEPLTAERVAGFKNSTLPNLNKLKQELWQDRSLWEKHLMPIFNSIIALFVRLEAILGVPPSWRPGLFKAHPTLLETRVNELSFDHVFDELDAYVRPATTA